METVLKFDNAAREKVVAALSSEAMKLFVDKTKSATDSGTFEMVITTDDIDRMGEMIKLDGWDFANYMKSPVVLWGHNYSLPPIGVTTSLTKQGNGWVAQGKFAPTDFAQQIRTLYDMGMNNASSVGFMVEEQEGNIITKAQLLEWSFVSVPANPFALSLRDLSNVQSEEVAGVILKGIIEKMKIGETKINEKEGGAPDETMPEPTMAEGQPCVTYDGKPGTFKKDNTGLVCMPSEASVKTEVADTKGPVAEEITAEEAMDAKYANVDGVWTIFCAFMDVYFDEATPVEDFNTLLTEMVTLLQKVADGSSDDSADAKMFGRAKTDITIIALKSIFASKSDDGSTANIDADESEDAKTAKQVLEGRKILQDVATALKDGLTKLKPVAKTLY